MASAASDVPLAIVGGGAILYGLFLTLAVFIGRVGTSAVALGLGLLLVLEGVRTLHALAE
ncbi:hypothetical protein [Halopiger thermotolerans]